MLSRYQRVLLWVAIVVYVAALPYAIVLFDFLREWLSLSVVKSFPALLLVLVSLAYVRFCRAQQQGYRLTTFVMPCALLVLGVYFLESNPIKYIHIPEYMLLTILVYFAIYRSDDTSAIIAAAIYAAMLGVIDEVHHGIHPARYFGWKDMVINLAGSCIGALTILTFKQSLDKRKIISASDKSVKAKVAIRHISSVLVLIVCTSIAVYSVIKLFDVASTSSFNVAYSARLVGLNVLSVVTCLALSACHLKTTRGELYFFFPPIILAMLQCLIIFSYFQNISFL